MKKQTILFLAGSLLALASCGGGNNANQENAQAKLDSMQKAMDMQVQQHQKDSMAAAMNAEKAKSDSLAGAMKKEEEKMASGKHHEAKHGNATANSNTPPPPPPPATSQNKWNNQQQTPNNQQPTTTSQSKWGNGK
jgi:hypothetical protein